MSKNIKKIRAEYELELLKQTKPYEYYVTHIEHELEGETELPFNSNEGFPQKCSCVPGGRFYDYDDYLVFEEENGYASEAERQYLVTFARKLNADLVFSDIDFVDAENKKQAIFYKPDYDKDTYAAFRYASDFYAVRKELNNTPISNLENIAHVTKVLFHSFYGKDEKIQPVTEYINEKYCNHYITPDYYSDNSITDETVSVIIPSKDNPELLERCLTGIQNAKIKSKFNNINVHIIDNGSSENNMRNITDVIEKVRETGGLDIHYTYESQEFNFSKMCNMGAKASDADYFLFLNDDIEIMDDDFIVKLLYYARQPHVGAVGCKLLYPNGKIQHVGITDLKYAGPTHKLSTFDDDKSLYFGRNRGVHNCLAVTGACLMVSSDKFFKIGGFYDKMKVGYNDVDLCVSLYENGYHNIVNNDLKLIHHESVTRGADDKDEKKLARLKEERDLLYKRHTFLKEKGDPYYNPNLAGDFLDYRINVIPEFEQRSYRSPLAPIKLRHSERPAHSMQMFKCKTSKHLHYNIESVETKIDAETLEKYIEIKGWALLNKKDNSIFDTYICILNKNSNNSNNCSNNVNNNNPSVQESYVNSGTGHAGQLERKAFRRQAWSAQQTGEPCEATQATTLSEKVSPSLTVPAIFSTARIYRSDLKTVFPDAKNVDLSGFLARIDIATLNNIGIENIENLNISAILHNKLTGKNFYGKSD